MPFSFADVDAELPMVPQLAFPMPTPTLNRPTPIPTPTPPSSTSDRAELIERIKAGESPTWSPSRNVGLRRDARPLHGASVPADMVQRQQLTFDGCFYPNYSPTSAPRLADDHPYRPQSALHQGVFTNEARNTLPGSPPPPSSTFHKYGYSFAEDTPPQIAFPEARIRKPSLSSSFVLKAPTSPLARSSNPDSDAASSTDPIDISRFARRKSLPHSALSSLQFSPSAATRCQTYSSIPAQRIDVSMSQRRRLSGVGNSSELPFGSFVGSYEESILNGRMSTTPSKPLSFLAQLGVLGLGKCKQSLRCPAHVMLPFPAYFYSVGDYDSPSPYVGQIDLDSALSKVNKPPPGIGGSYRIPQRGQLQIVIKNPNKTAVKLFLVPYDLGDMGPGTKTFIRQKAYSVAEDAEIKEKDSLRYLIHLHIVCPSRGRYYIFRSIRVVFANRVPDGKERLRNESLWPEPKYSAWKPEAQAASPIRVRGRSASLYSSSSAIHMPPPAKPEDMDVDVAYEKRDLSGSIQRVAEGRGLLARKLKELEVEPVGDTPAPS